MKKFLLLLVGILSLMSGFGQTATYTITSTTAVTTGGTTPSGSSATYSQTFGTAKQMTNGNSTTLTLSGYAGYQITSIVLEMRSNTSAGAGTLSVVAGSTTISSVSPTATFNSASWNGAYSTTYTNVTKTPSAYAITTGQNVVITIAATTNSLYIQKYSITYASAGNTVTFDANGGTGTMAAQTASSATNLNANAFSRIGYAFAGWATSAGGSVAYADGASYPFSANATLYAQWTPTPTITVGSAAMSGFTYVSGAGPSTSQSNTIAWANLTGSIANVNTINNFEFSLDNVTFSTAAVLTIPIPTPFPTTSVTPQTVYVRLKSGLAVGSYSETLLFASTGATSVSVTLSGTVTPLCATPTNQATSLAFANITASSIDVSFTAASPAADKYLVVQSTSATLSASPTDASTYAVSTSLGGGTVVYNGSGTSFTASGLSSSTTYYYFVFAYNDAACSGGPKYKTPALVDSETTISGPCVSESFANSNATSSYADNSFTGDNGFTWTYVASRDENGDANSSGISGKAIMLRRSSDNSKITSASVPGGIADFSCKLYKGFTGGGNRQVELFVNGTSYGTSTVFDDFLAHTFTVTGINITGNVIIELRNVTGSQIIVDNIEWTCMAATAEIEIQSNSTEIVSGDVTPSLTDHTDFGNVAEAGGTASNTYIIYNTGGAALNLTGTSPYVVISGTHASDFTLTANPSTPIAASSNTSFEITFNPSALGLRTASISIANDDSDENPYTFNIQGTGVNSNTSDIIESPGFTYTSNIDYTIFQDAGPITNASNNVGVFRFDIIDGGSTAPDADALGTELNSITFSLGATHAAFIRTAALFDGLSMRANAPTINVGAGTITFSGLSGANFTAADNDTLTLTLRVSFLTTVTDNAQLQFTVSAATANASGSVFAVANAGAATSSITGDRNRLEVMATKLVYTTNASNSTVGASMATVVVAAQDANNNTDLDFTSSVSITSTGTLTGSPVSATATSGVASFTSLVHTVAGTGLTLGATSGSLTSATSTPFDIVLVTFTHGDYRTTSAGTWPAGTATWERYNSGTGTWAAATPASNTTNLLIIRHAIDSRASFASSSPYTTMKVETGGIFNDAHNSTFGSLLVESGGKFIASDPAVDIHSTGTLTVESGGTFVINSGTLNNLDGLFDGTENFEAGSTVEIQDWDNDSSPGEDDLIDIDNDITLNADGYYFGNLYINFNPTDVSKAFTLVGKIGTHKLCKNDLTITNYNSAKQVQLTNVNANVEIGGNVLITKNQFGFGTLSTVNVVHTVKGNITVNGSDAIMEMNSTSSDSASVGVNLEGDLIGIAGTMKSVDGDCFIAFTNTTTQNIDVADAVPFNNINVYVRSDANVQLLNNDLKLNSSSTFTVEDGGTFNFNWTGGTTPLKISNGGSGSNKFDSNQGSTLKITSPQGIVKTVANAGNVHLSVSNKTFNQTATFHYIGKVNQETGDALTSGSTAKTIICQLESNALTLTATNTTGTSVLLDIKKGVVVNTDAANIYGSGNLTITDGGLRTSVLTSTGTVPLLTGTYSLSAGFVELNANGDQTLRGAKDYFDLIISGSNSAGTNDKTATSAFTVANKLTITGTPIFDIESKGMTGAAGITMNGGLLRISKVSLTTPELTGFATPYSLTGGTVEWYGSSAAQYQNIKGTYGSASTAISYANIEVNAAAANTTNYNVGLQAGIELTGVMNINNPAVFQMDAADHIDGTGTFNVLSGSTFYYADEFGITLGTSTVTSAGALRMSTARTAGNFSTNASYGFVGNGAMVSGNGLPDSCVNLYTRKNVAADEITLTNALKVKGDLNLETGVLVSTASTLLSIADNATATGASDNSYVSGQCRKIGNEAFIFPVGKAGNYQAVGISAPSVTTDHFTAEYFQADPHPTYNESSKDATINHISSCEYWILNRTNGSSDVSVSLDWDANSCGVTNLSDLLVARWDGSTWKDHGNGGTSGSLGAGTVTSGAAITSFSPFTLASKTILNPLPVELLFFEVENKENDVLVSWATVTEINNDFFTVERSQNGKDFEAIGEVKGAGNYSGKLDYMLLDTKPLNGISYYRLKQTDFDGKFEYSDIRTISRNNGVFEIGTAYPNPTNDVLNIPISGNANGNIEISVYDITGRQIFVNVNNSESNLIQLNVSNLLSGTYVLKLKTSAGSKTIRFIKK